MMPKTNQEPNIKISDPVEEFTKRFDKLFFLIIGAMLIGFITMLFMVAGIVIESWRSTSLIYKDYQNNQNQQIMINTLNNIEQRLKNIESK